MRMSSIRYVTMLFCFHNKPFPASLEFAASYNHSIFFSFYANISPLIARIKFVFSAWYNKASLRPNLQSQTYAHNNFCSG